MRSVAFVPAVALLAVFAACEDELTIGPPAVNPVGAYASELASAPRDEPFDDADPRALTDFRAALDPYGEWRDEQALGTVWIPRAVAGGFVPYVSSGRWAFDDGFVWVSDLPWGWVTFHYGRWARSASGAWAWVPGRAYADAWVVWRLGDGAVGWGPRAPSFVWRDGIALRLRSRPATEYVHCTSSDVFARDLTARIITGAALMQPGRAGEGRRAATADAPTLAQLGLDASRAPGLHDPGVARARAYSRPTTMPALPAALPHPPRVPGPPELPPRRH